MSPSEIARLLRGRRSGKGKWMARCPNHRERTGSLSICDMGQGNTRLNCFAGCAQIDVLKAAGLTWRDLKPSGVVAPEIRGRLADERKLERLQRHYGLMIVLAILEPEKRRYWEAAQRRVIKEMEPLYWGLMPDRERFDKIREFEIEDYRNKRLDWLHEREERDEVYGKLKNA